MVRTTLKCIVVLQLRGAGLGNCKKFGAYLTHSFSSFHDLLPVIGEQCNVRQQCSSDYFP